MVKELTMEQDRFEQADICLDVFKELIEPSILTKAVTDCIFKQTKPRRKKKKTLFTSIGVPICDIIPMDFIHVDNHSEHSFSSRLSMADNEFSCKMLTKRNVFQLKDSKESPKIKKNRCQNLCRALRLIADVQAYRALFSLVFLKDNKKIQEIKDFIYLLITTNSYWQNQLAAFLGSKNHKISGLDRRGEIVLETKSQKILGLKTLSCIKESCYKYGLFIDELLR